MIFIVTAQAATKTLLIEASSEEEARDKALDPDNEEAWNYAKVDWDEFAIIDVTEDPLAETKDVAIP